MNAARRKERESRAGKDSTGHGAEPGPPAKSRRAPAGKDIFSALFPLSSARSFLFYLLRLGSRALKDRLGRILFAERARQFRLGFCRVCNFLKLPPFRSVKRLGVEGANEGVVEELHEATEDLPVDDQVRIAGSNAADLYNL